MRKRLSALLAIILTLSSLNIAVLAETSEAVLNSEASTFNALVPTILPINVDKNQNVSVATDVALTNNSTGPIVVTGIRIDPVHNWIKVNTVSDKVGLTEFTLDVSVANEIIPAKQSTLISYTSTVSPQKGGTEETIANVIFTLGWDAKLFPNTEFPEQSSAPLYPNESRDIVLKFENLESDLITWHSSNEAVATVQESVKRAALISGEKLATIVAISPGSTTITAKSSSGSEANIEVVVTEIQLSSLEVVAPPTKTSYIEGETFNKSGLVVNGIYNNNSVKNITNDLEISTDKLQLEQSSIVLSYQGLTIEQSISVRAKAVARLQIKTPATKTEYLAGETFDPSGIIVESTYDNNTTEIITGYTLSNTTNLKVGQTNISIEYAGKTILHPITVLALPVYGEVYRLGNYNYTYNGTGWKASIIDKTKTHHIQPLEVIKGKPVNSYEGLFEDSDNTVLVLEGIWTNANVTNMDSTFRTTYANEIDISNFNTPALVDMSSMFASSRTPVLKGLTNLDTSNVTNMYDVFYNNYATTLDLSKFNTSKVTNMVDMFYGSRATTIDVSNFDTGNVTDMESMFGTGQVKSLDVSKFNTSKVTNMRGMFESLPITSLNLSSFDTSNVTDMRQMFIESQIVTIDLSSFDTSKVTAFGEMFSYGKTKTVLAKSPADVTRLNTSSYKPTGLVIRVK